VNCSAGDQDSCVVLSRYAPCHYAEMRDKLDAASNSSERESPVDKRFKGVKPERAGARSRKAPLPNSKNWTPWLTKLSAVKAASIATNVTTPLRNHVIASAIAPPN